LVELEEEVDSVGDALGLDLGYERGGCNKEFFGPLFIAV
jgi:hypothetical protein